VPAPCAAGCPAFLLLCAEPLPSSLHNAGPPGARARSLPLPASAAFWVATESKGRRATRSCLSAHSCRWRRKAAGQNESSPPTPLPHWPLSRSVRAAHALGAPQALEPLDAVTLHAILPRARTALIHHLIAPSSAMRDSSAAQRPSQLTHYSLRQLPRGHAELPVFTHGQEDKLHHCWLPVGKLASVLGSWRVRGTRKMATRSLSWSPLFGVYLVDCLKSCAGGWPQSA
jgi:hypothetical protein